MRLNPVQYRLPTYESRCEARPALSNNLYLNPRSQPVHSCIPGPPALTKFVLDSFGGLVPVEGARFLVLGMGDSLCE